MFFDPEASDAFTLLDIIKDEQKVMSNLYNIGLSHEHIQSLLTLDFTEKSAEYAVDIRDSSVMYVNDIENDPQYTRWPTALVEILRPMFPGMLPHVRKNLFHMVIIADTAKSSAKDLLKLAESFLIHRVPLRMGVVFSVNSDKAVTGMADGGVALLNAYNFISEDKTSSDALSFITDVYAAVGNSDVTASDVHKAFKKKYKYHGTIESVAVTGVKSTSCSAR